jgi:hypothetical protein
MSVVFNNATTPAFVSASGDGTWTHCPASLSTINLSSRSVTADCALILSATGGATAETFTWNFPLDGNQEIDVKLFEVHRSGGTATYAAGNGTGLNRLRALFRSDDHFKRAKFRCDVGRSWESSAWSQ